MGQKTHAIIGTGATSKKSLYESLDEVVKEGDAVSIVWAGSPNATVELVYDYVVDNEIEFTMFYEDGHNPPKVFRTSDNGVCQKSRNPLVAAAKSVSNGGKLLILWEDDEQEDYINAADATAKGTLFLELSNGLAPISFEDADEEEPEVEEEEVEEDDDENFTREELVAMPAAAVKRYGAKKGAKAATKGGIIDELFPEEEEDEATEEEEVEEAPAPKKVKPASFDGNSNDEADFERLALALSGQAPYDHDVERIALIRSVAKDLGQVILEEAPFGRERALAITKLEETVMWAVQAITLG